MRFNNSIAAVVALFAPVFYLTVLSGANSPIADAAMRGDTAEIRKLIASKADVNLAQADGATAIHWPLSGNTIIPGLIEAHTHASFDADMRAYEERCYHDSFRGSRCR